MIHRDQTTTDVPVLATEEGTIDGYRVIYARTPRNWAAHAPDLPRIIATGKDRRHIEQMMREAMALYFEPDEA